jgi:hypothetical protein
MRAPAPKTLVQVVNFDQRDARRIAIAANNDRVSTDRQRRKNHRVGIICGARPVSLTEASSPSFPLSLVAITAPIPWWSRRIGSG